MSWNEIEMNRISTIENLVVGLRIDIVQVSLAMRVVKQVGRGYGKEVRM